MSHDADYWAKRALQREQEAYMRGAELSTKLYREYELATRRIRQQVSEFYGRYAAERGITYADAVRALNTRERQEWKKSLRDYLAEIAAEEDPRVKARLKAELDALSYNSQITRLEALHAQINQELNTLHARGVEQMKAEFGDLFTESFTRKMYDIQSRVGYVFEFAKIDSAMVENIVSYPWSGADFSARLWKNKQQLTFVMRETLTQGMINGTSVAQMSKTLSEAMGASYKAAERVVRTEANHFHNEATKRAYAAAGLDQYEYMATLDSRTSLVCQALDGKTFELADAKEGANYPPMHPNCRSTTVEYDPDEVQDWEAIGKPMPARQTYEEWKAEQETEPPDELIHRPIAHKAPKREGNAPVGKKPRSVLENAEMDIVDEPIEHAVVVTRDGEIWHCYGTKDRVFPDADLSDKLKGASVTHNHPAAVTEYGFSSDDFNLFMANDLEILRGVDEMYVYEFNRTGVVDSPVDDMKTLTSDDAYHEQSIRMANERGVGYWRMKRGPLK